MTITEMTSVRKTGAAWLPVGLAVFLGLLANILFYNRPLGISLPAFTLLGLAALYGLAESQGVRPAWRNLWLPLLIAFFSGMVAVRAHAFTTFLNLCAAFLLGLLLAHYFSGKSLFSLGWLDYLSTLIVSSIEILFIRPVTALAAAEKSFRHRGAAPGILAALLRGLALAAPVLLIFTLLLSSADAVFSGLVQDLLHWLRLDNLPELAARLIFTLLSAWVVLGGLGYALRSPETASPRLSVSPSAPLGLTEAAMVLGSVDLLFAAFVAVQFRYFFGGQSNIHLAGLTYAEYTRRGFAELLIVTVFSLGLALLLQRLTARPSRSAAAGFKVLAALLVALTGVLLLSAFQRLLLYEQAYGFTELRTYVHVFMSWVGVLLAAFLAFLLTDRPRGFTFALLLAGLGFIVTLNILNTDAFIVRQNLARYAATGKLDAAYLATLSDDAVPGLLDAMDRVGPSEREILGSALHFRLNQLTEIEPRAGWVGWQASRSRAYRLLLQASADLQQYAPQRYYWSFPID